jgi:predicted SAM-dependent methyltransferase
LARYFSAQAWQGLRNPGYIGGHTGPRQRRRRNPLFAARYNDIIFLNEVLAMMTNNVSPNVSSSGIKLHIGGQEKCEGWSILDALPGPNVDYVGNCKDLSFLPSESCSEVYASHVLEHLGYTGELQQTLSGIHRVLRPSGRLRVSVPDLEILCKLFLHPALDGPGRFHVMRMMFGGRLTDYDVHYVGLTFEFLGEYLDLAGFRNIKRVPGFGLFQDTSTFHFAGVPISLNVEATK